MSQKDIIFPHFLHCCQETKDVFWKYIFEDLSCGRAPYGVYFTKGFLCCGFKGKEFSYKVDPNKPIPELFTEVQEILKTKLGIQSINDREAQRKRFEKTSSDCCLSACNDWSDIKRKEVRCILLENFMTHYDSSWSRSRIKKALSCVLLLLQLKKITSNDIKIRNGRIEEIVNLEKYINLSLKDWKLDSKRKPDNKSKKKMISLWKE